MQLTDLLKAIFILFAIVNPIGSIPIFLQLTGGMSLEKRRKALQIAVFVSAIILFSFLIAGERILTQLFQIRMSDLMIAGGALLLIIAIDHLVFGTLVRGVLGKGQRDAHHIGAVPIACPILAGPGAMMTVLVTSSEQGVAVSGIAIVAVLGITWLIFQFIDKIYNFLGKTVCVVLSKILCLFIAAVGVNLLMDGLSNYFK